MRRPREATSGPAPRNNSRPQNDPVLPLGRGSTVPDRLSLDRLFRRRAADASRPAKHPALERAVMETLEQRRLLANVAAAHLFYNQSAFDGGDPYLNAADDAAIATDKVPLRELGEATFANYSGYDRGINGVMIDLELAGARPQVSDFVFRAGNDLSDPFVWAAAPAPSIMSIRPGAGVGGSTRVSFSLGRHPADQEQVAPGDGAAERAHRALRAGRVLLRVGRRRGGRRGRLDPGERDRPSDDPPQPAHAAGPRAGHGPLRPQPRPQGRRDRPAHRPSEPDDVPDGPQARHGPAGPRDGPAGGRVQPERGAVDLAGPRQGRGRLQHPRVGRPQGTTPRAQAGAAERHGPRWSRA